MFSHQIDFQIVDIFMSFVFCSMVKGSGNVENVGIGCLVNFRHKLCVCKTLGFDLEQSVSF